MIRPARPADAERIWALVLELAEYERLSHVATGSADRLQACLFGEKSCAEALVAEVEGEIVGYSIFFPTFSTFLARPGLWMEDLYVTPAHRGKGYGLALLRAVAAVARERNCARMEWSVLDWNQPAIDLYTSLGATLLEDWRICRLTRDEIDAVSTS